MAPQSVGQGLEERPQSQFPGNLPGVSSIVTVACPEEVLPPLRLR